MDHSFDPEAAQNYGVNSAIVLQHLKRWIAHNKSNNTNLRDGRTWTYNSIRAWKELIPYLTPKQIRTAIDVLVSAGAIVKSNYNADKRDTTTWYALGGPASSGPEGNTQLPFEASALALEGKPLLQSGTTTNLPEGGGEAEKGKPEPIKEAETEDPQRQLLKEEAKGFVRWFKEELANTGAKSLRITESAEKAWADCYEKLIRIDGRTKAEIVKVCRWARAHEFWGKNFLSPMKLRDKNPDKIAYYDVFLDRMRTEALPRPGRGPVVPVMSDEERERGYRTLREMGVKIPGHAVA